MGSVRFQQRKISWRLLPSAARVRPAPVAVHNFPSVRCAPLTCANDLTPCRDGLAFWLRFRSRSNFVKTPGPYGYAGVVVHRSTIVTLPVLLQGRAELRKHNILHTRRQLRAWKLIGIRALLSLWYRALRRLTYYELSVIRESVAVYFLQVIQSLKKFENQLNFFLWVQRIFR